MKLTPSRVSECLPGALSPSDAPRATNPHPNCVSGATLVRNTPSPDQQDDATYGRFGSWELCWQQVKRGRNSNQRRACNESSAVDHHTAAPSPSFIRCLCNSDDSVNAEVWPHRLMASDKSWSAATFSFAEVAMLWACGTRGDSVGDQPGDARPQDCADAATFVRTIRGVGLTEAGERFRSGAKPALRRGRFTA